MGNAVKYECEKSEGGCTYWEALHAIEGFNFHDEKYKKCSHCTKPLRLEAYKRHWGERSKQ